MRKIITLICFIWCISTYSQKHFEHLRGKQDKRGSEQAEIPEQRHGRLQQRQEKRQNYGKPVLNRRQSIRREYKELSVL